MEMVSLDKLWQQYGSKFGAEQETVKKYWEIITAKYSEFSRFYHTLHHLEEMFVHFNSLLEKLSDPAEVAMAIFFHDIIYEPSKPNNEERSAELFKQFAEECTGIDTQKVHTVYDWIMQTKSHMTDVTMETGVYGEGDMYYFMDMDMAILAESPDRYREYASQIKQEYSHRTDYSSARAKVLRTFLERKNIYNTEYFRSRCEEKARQNLMQEIQSLEQNAT